MLEEDIMAAFGTMVLNEDDFPFRGHLGASVLGANCELQLFFSFRWVKDVQHDTRIERIFGKGRREELLMLKHLRKIGLTVTTDIDGSQIRVPMPPHLGGSTDGVITVPEAYVHLYGNYMPVEIKTHKNTTFNRVKKKPLNDAMPPHWCQANIYATRLCTSHFMYFAKNKNDEEYHVKIYQANPQIANVAIDRGSRIVFARSRDIVGKVSAKHECNMCDYQAICKQRLPAESRNCRSCKRGTPLDNGIWVCALDSTEIIYKTEIDRAAQCEHWESLI